MANKARSISPSCVGTTIARFRANRGSGEILEDPISPVVIEPLLKGMFVDIFENDTRATRIQNRPGTKRAHIALLAHNPPLSHAAAARAISSLRQQNQEPGEAGMKNGCVRFKRTPGLSFAQLQTPRDGRPKQYFPATKILSMAAEVEE